MSDLLGGAGAVGQDPQLALADDAVAGYGEPEGEGLAEFCTPVRYAVDPWVAAVTQG